MSDTPQDVAIIPLLSGTIGVSRCPGRSGTLEASVSEIAAAGFREVVTLIEPHEQPDLVSRMSALLAPQGIDWTHLPITDYGTPDARIARLIESRLPAWLERLAAGERLLLHCWGGNGRSGMLALRLMVTAGERPETALARLRQVRPGAVETDAQWRWASEGAG